MVPPRPAVGTPQQRCHHPNSQPHTTALPHCLHWPGRVSGLPESCSSPGELLCWSINMTPVPTEHSMDQAHSQHRPGGGDRDSSQWGLGTVTPGDGRAFRHSWERNSPFLQGRSQAWVSCFIPLSSREKAGRSKFYSLKKCPVVTSSKRSQPCTWKRPAIVTEGCSLPPGLYLEAVTILLPQIKPGRDLICCILALTCSCVLSQ